MPKITMSEIKRIVAARQSSTNRTRPVLIRHPSCATEMRPILRDLGRLFEKAQKINENFRRDRLQRLKQPSRLDKKTLAAANKKFAKVKKAVASQIAERRKMMERTVAINSPPQAFSMFLDPIGVWAEPYSILMDASFGPLGDSFARFQVRHQSDSGGVNWVHCYYVWTNETGQDVAITVQSSIEAKGYVGSYAYPTYVWDGVCTAAVFCWAEMLITEIYPGTAPSSPMWDNDQSVLMAQNGAYGQSLWPPVPYPDGNGADIEFNLQNFGLKYSNPFSVPVNGTVMFEVGIRIESDIEPTDGADYTGTVADFYFPDGFFACPFVFLRGTPISSVMTGAA